MTVVPMPGSEIERHGPSLELQQYVSDDGLDQIQRALPDGVSLAKFDQAFMTAALANPDLAKVEKTSLFLALVDAAKRGLLPDGKQGAIVPFKNKATFIPMIGGVRDTLAEYGWLLVTSVVYENDGFAIDKAAAVVSHRPIVTGDRGPVIGAYAIAKHRDGRQRMADYMPIDEIHALRDKMGVGGNPAWKNWPNQMAEKTVGHRLADDIPLAPQDRRRVEWIINATELPPEDAAAALYGDHSRATFSELPSGVQPDTAPADEAAVDPPTVDDVSGGGDPESVPSEAGVAAATPTPLDDEAQMFAAEAAEYVPPVGKYAANGADGPLSLSEILDLGDDGRKYLDTVMRRSPNEELRKQVTAFARVQMPDEYAAAQAAAQQQAS